MLIRWQTLPRAGSTGPMALMTAPTITLISKFHGIRNARSEHSNVRTRGIGEREYRGLLSAPTNGDHVPKYRIDDRFRLIDNHFRDGYIYFLPGRNCGRGEQD